jgi:head-tail adaptor
MPGLARGELDSLIRIERPKANDAFDSAGSAEWEALPDGEQVWASVHDMLPSRGEKIASGINVAARPARVRMDYRDDVTAAMRFVDITDGVDGRVMQIISGPAKIGRREGVEFMVEDYSSAGNSA